MRAALRDKDQQLTQLRSDLAAATEDKERLDWLEKHVQMPYGWHTEKDDGERTGQVVWEWPHIEEVWTNLRSCLDAARSASPEGEKK